MCLFSWSKCELEPFSSFIYVADEVGHWQNEATSIILFRHDGKNANKLFLQVDIQVSMGENKKIFFVCFYVSSLEPWKYFEEKFTETVQEKNAYFY